jgi:hypothetical protein
MPPPLRANLARVRGIRAGRALAAALALACGAGSAGAHGMDLDLWAKLLERHTRSVADPAGTRVDYAALAGDPDWRRLVDALASAPEPAAGAPRAERLAYWINAYNVLAIDVVVRAWPVRSIRDAGSLLRPVWKREAGRVGGRPVTLDEIEHAILRPLGDPRIHAAIVCASTSCPSLSREPYRPERADEQLEAAARAFVADRRKGVRPEAQGLRVSRIFEWFAADFAAQEAAGRRGVLGFVRRHAGPELAAAIDALDADPPLAYFDYDWSLNGTRPPGDDGL